MTSRRTARAARTAGAVFGVGFAVLLLDGAGAIFLGQVSGRGALVGVGLLLVAAAVALVFAYRSWMAALEAVDVARRELQQEIGRLRGAVRDARAGGNGF